jgi:hypothetical protein
MTPGGCGEGKQRRMAMPIKNCFFEKMLKRMHVRQSPSRQIVR